MNSSKPHETTSAREFDSPRARVSRSIARREGKFMRTRTTVALLSGLILAVPAFAQDRPAKPTRPTSSSPTSARRAAVNAVPKWEAFGQGEMESQEETFFRLAQDFVSTSEVGVRRLGHVPLWPRGNLKIGSFRVLPTLRQGVEYETNVFKKRETQQFDDDGVGVFDDGRRSGWAYVTTASVLADTALAGGRLRLAGSLQGNWETRFRREQDDTFESDAQLGASYRWPSGFWVRGGVAYERKAEPIEIEQSSEFERTNRRGFFTFGFDRDIFFGTKIQFEAGVSVRDVDPHNDKDFGALDRTENSYYLKASYPFWKKTTRAFARFRYEESHRESSLQNDGDVSGVDFGIEGNIPLTKGETRGIRGTVSVGYDYGDYEDGIFTSSSGRRTVIDDDDRQGSLAIRGALQYVMSPRTSMDLRLLRTQQFSAFGNYQVTSRGDFTVSHTLNRRIVLRLGTYLEYSDPSNEFPRRVVRGANLIPRAPVPHTTRGGVGVGARYKLTDWADIDMSYDYERKNAGPQRSYSNHRALLGITFYLTSIRPRAYSSR